MYLEYYNPWIINGNHKNYNAVSCTWLVYCTAAWFYSRIHWECCTQCHWNKIFKTAISAVPPDGSNCFFLSFFFLWSCWFVHRIQLLWLAVYRIWMQDEPKSNWPDNLRLYWRARKLLWYGLINSADGFLPKLDIKFNIGSDTVYLRPKTDLMHGRYPDIKSSDIRQSTSSYCMNILPVPFLQQWALLRNHRLTLSGTEISFGNY